MLIAKARAHSRCAMHNNPKVVFCVHRDPRVEDRAHILTGGRPRTPFQKHCCNRKGCGCRMTVLAAGGKAAYSVLGVAEVSMWASPSVSLVLTSVIAPRVSFLGHLAGTVSGFAVCSPSFHPSSDFPVVAHQPVL